MPYMPDYFLATAVATGSVSAASVPGVSVMRQNLNRKFFSIFNDSPSAAYVKFGPSGTLQDFCFQLPAYAYYESPIPCVSSEVWGCWQTATGSVKFSEASW